MFALTISALQVGQPDSEEAMRCGYNAEWIELMNVGNLPFGVDGLYLQIKTCPSLQGAGFHLRPERKHQTRRFCLAPWTRLRLFSGSSDENCSPVRPEVQCYFLDAGRFLLHPVADLVAIYKTEADCLHNRLPLVQIVYGDWEQTLAKQSISSDEVPYSLP